MSETLERLQYDTPHDGGTLTAEAQTVVEEIPAGYEDRLGVLVPFSESERHLRANILDYDMLKRVAGGMAWHNNNPGDVAYYAARALGKADGDEEWQMHVGIIRNSIGTLHAIADDPATKHYGDDEHILLETIIAMCNLDESWNE